MYNLFVIRIAFFKRIVVFFRFLTNIFKNSYKVIDSYNSIIFVSFVHGYTNSPAALVLVSSAGLNIHMKLVQTCILMVYSVYGFKFI